MTSVTEGVGRRRVPRRTFNAQVGILFNGKYVVERSYQLGEGGMMIDCKGQQLNLGNQVIANFFLPTGLIIMVRGTVRTVIPAEDKIPQRYGIEFENLGFQNKRAIRTFVAAATRGDGYTAA